MKKRLICLLLSITFALCVLSVGSVALSPPSETADINFRLGPAEVNEPFNFFQDGTFSLAKIGSEIYTLPPVNNVDTCDQFVWSGTDIDNLYPKTFMQGLTANAHYDRGRIYDAYGWWPFSLWVDNSGKWYSYMHTEDSIQVDTGNIGHGSDLRTIALWTSIDQGAHWVYEGVSLSIDSQYAVPGNLQTNWPRNGGTGDHKMVISKDGQYLYILYTVFTYDNPEIVSNHVHGNLCVARAVLDSNGVPGPFKKYYNGGFSQPGVGGHETFVMSPTGVPTKDNSQRSVQWNEYLKKYVMVFADRIDHLNISFSDDLVSWSTPQFLMRYDNFTLYANMVSFASDDKTGGKSVWLYYVTGDDYTVYRRSLTFDVASNIAAGKSIIASSRQAAATYNGTTYSAAYLTDSNYRTGWIGTGFDNANQNNYFTIDLGSELSFNSIWLVPDRKGEGFPDKFVISASNSELGPWTTLYSGNGYKQPISGETQEFYVGNRSYRYIQVSARSSYPINDSGYPSKFFMRMNEIKVFNLTDTQPDDIPAYGAQAEVYQASIDFSNTQGMQHWSFMRQGDLNLGTEKSFFWSPLAYNASLDAWVHPTNGLIYTQIGNNWMHPHTNLQSARVWKAPADGIVRLTGNVRKKDIGGDGVRIKVQINRTRVWPSEVAWQTIGGNDTTGINIDKTFSVKANEKILFIIDSNSTPDYDATYWDPIIDFKPVASVYDSSADFGSHGNGSWSYLAETGINTNTYTSLSWNADNSRYEQSGTYCIIDSNTIHPGVDNNTVLAWTAPNSGTVVIQNTIKKFDVRGGDGVNLKILKNSGSNITRVWPQSDSWKPLLANDANGYIFQVPTEVNVGDTLYFVVNRGPATNVDYDLTYWNVQIIAE